MNKDYEWSDYQRAFEALSKALFTFERGSLITFAEFYSAKVTEFKDKWWHYEHIKYDALVYAINEVMGDDARRLIEVGVRALNERPHYEYKPGNGFNRNRYRHAAYQIRVDEADEWHWSHRCSKSWKDQSKKRRQWQR